MAIKNSPLSSKKKIQKQNESWSIFFQVQREKNLEKTRGWFRRRYIGSQSVDGHHGSPSTRKQRKLNSRHKSIIPFARSFVPDQFRCPFTGSKRAVSICGWACGTILSAEQRSIGQSRGSGGLPLHRGRDAEGRRRSNNFRPRKVKR